MAEPDPLAPVRFGALYSTTGLTAVTERLLLSAVKFAASEVNAAGGIDGREVQIVHFDPGSDPLYYRYLAEQLMTEHAVDAIFGCYMSSARMAVKPVVEKQGGLLFYPAQYEGFEYSKNIIYGGAVANQNCAQLADYLSRHGGPRIYVVGSAYVWPRESARTMRELMATRGGTTVGDAFLKLDAPREAYDAVIKAVRKADPDVIFCNLVGPSIGQFYAAYADSGLDPGKMPIASLTTSETDIQAMEIEPAVGHITAAAYFQSVETSENKAALRRFDAWAEAPWVTNMVWEAAYSQVHLAAQAMAQLGTSVSDPLRKAVLGSAFDAPQGRILVDADTNHTCLWPRIGRVNEAGQFDIVEQSASRAKPDPYLTSYSVEDGRLRRAK